MFRPSLPAVAFAAVLALSAEARADGYSNTYFFGDSLSDAGAFAPFLPPGAGRFTTNPGPVWAENLAAALGTDGSTVTAGGTNFAQGGARVTNLPGYPAAAPTGLATPIRTQIDTYLALRGRADPEALYSVWGGANDLFVALESSLNPLADVAASASDLVAAIGTLKAAGARHVLVPTMPDVGATPFGVSIGPGSAAGVTLLSGAYNQFLFNGLAASGLEVIPLDTFSLLREVAADPPRYGFSNVTERACGATPSLLCTTAALVAPDADRSYLFADDVHPSSGGHRVIADYALSVLRAPGAVSLLAEVPVDSAAGLSETLHRRGDDRAPESGRSAWASLSGGRIEYDSQGSTPGADGQPYFLEAGVDAAVAPGLVLGAALVAGRVEADFSADSGRFDLDQHGLALYGRYRLGALQASAILAAATLDYDLRREVPLGPARRAMKGSTTGSNLSFGLRATYAMQAGRVTHGPLLDLLTQQIEVDGFAERGHSSTAMRFASQDRNSMVGSVGYQAAVELETYRPFARVALQREFLETERMVRASLTNFAANSFELPAHEADRNGASAAFGVTARLSPKAHATLAASARFGRDDARSLAVQAEIRSVF